MLFHCASLCRCNCTNQSLIHHSKNRYYRFFWKRFFGTQELSSCLGQRNNLCPSMTMSLTVNSLCLTSELHLVSRFYGGQKILLQVSWASGFPSIHACFHDYPRLPLVLSSHPLNERRCIPNFASLGTQHHPLPERLRSDQQGGS